MAVDVAWAVGSGSGALVLLAASPYLASASAAAVAPGRWWRWATASSSRHRTTAIAATATVAGALGGSVTRTSLRWWPAFVMFAAAAVVLAVVDVEQHRLPDRVVAPATALEVVLLVGAAAVSGQWARLGQTGLGAAVLTVVMAVLWVASRGDLGLGDVKLAPLLGSCSGGWVGGTWGWVC